MALSEGLKVFGGCVSVEGLVGSESVELVGEGVDPSVDDVCVEFGGPGREFEEDDAAFPAFVFEAGFELGAAVGLYGLDTA